MPDLGHNRVPNRLKYMEFLKSCKERYGGPQRVRVLLTYYVGQGEIANSLLRGRNDFGLELKFDIKKEAREAGWKREQKSRGQPGW